MNFIYEWCKHNNFFLVAAFIFFLFLCRNPYSNRTLIPNLEPYPDSIHYISPALNFLHGQGLYIAREGRKILPSVPPLYSFALMPGFIINSDARTFYFTNVLLGFLSLFLFYQIGKSLFPKQRFLIFFLLFLYVTNYTLYWYAELAMAENLIIPLFLLTLYLLLQKPTRLIAVSMGILTVSFYATKFSSLPLSLFVPFLFIVRILTIKVDRKKLWFLLYFFVSLSISGSIYTSYAWWVRHENVIGGLIGLVFSLLTPKMISSAVQGKGGGGTFFSLGYARTDASAYLNWLIGKQMAVLWKQVAILPKYLALPAILGFIISPFSKKLRWFTLAVLGFLVVNIMFMMTFYVADGRYFIIAIPSLILGVGFFLATIKEKIPKKYSFISPLLIIVFFGLYSVMNLSRFKFDVMLNMRYSETPWYYMSIRAFDEYLSMHRSEFKQKPVIISALPPYLVDFYAGEKFILLPLSSGQEFRSHTLEAWGNWDYSNLLSVYEQLIRSGRSVYLTQYGLGNEVYLHNAFNMVLNKFTFKVIDSGCFNLCNIYQLIAVKTLH